MSRAVFVSASLVLVGIAVSVPASADGPLGPFELDAGSYGPYVGVVKPGETDAHSWENRLAGLCAAPAIFVVAATWAPTSATLTVSFAGASVTRSGGTSVFKVSASACRDHTLEVTGTAVDPIAAYQVDVLVVAQPDFNCPYGSPWCPGPV